MSGGKTCKIPELMKPSQDDNREKKYIVKETGKICLNEGAVQVQVICIAIEISSFFVF